MKRAIKKIAGKTLFTILPFVLFTALWKALTAYRLPRTWR